MGEDMPHFSNINAVEPKVGNCGIIFHTGFLLKMSAVRSSGCLGVPRFFLRGIFSENAIHRILYVRNICPRVVGFFCRRTFNHTKS